MNKYEVALQHFDDELTSSQFIGSDLIIDLEDAELIKELLEQKFDKEDIMYNIRDLMDNIDNLNYDCKCILNKLED